MAYDDQRGRTGDFSLRAPGQGPKSGPNYGVPAAPSFLGSEAGGFLQGGGNGGGFVNFSQYLMANPQGAGEPDQTPRTQGQAGIDTAMNNAYGVHVYGDPNAGTGSGTPPPAAPPAPIAPANQNPLPGHGGGAAPPPPPGGNPFTQKYLR